ncbi:MAG TPA: hypothetical protein VFA67_15800 [Candidatus Sulfotelmatobacter sp.]|nr:hypothetical protein [Candidatus Sulfotelmatobacter sp.]
MSPEPVENLELRAIHQRQRLHQTTAELKGKITATRRQFDPSRNLHQHFLPVAIAVGAIGVLAGYGIGGMFTRR